MKKEKRVFLTPQFYFYRASITHAKINPSIRRREEHRTNSDNQSKVDLKKEKKEEEEGRIVPYESRTSRSLSRSARVHTRHRAPDRSVAYAK